MTENSSLLSTISIRYVIIVAVIILALVPVLVVFNILPEQNGDNLPGSHLRKKQQGYIFLMKSA
jgi:hypothetical protein